MTDNLMSAKLFVLKQQSICIYTAPLTGKVSGNEIWIVKELNQGKIVLSHFITTHDFTWLLNYASIGDVNWRQADRSEIPETITKGAKQEEKMIRNDTYLDLESLSDYFGCLGDLSMSDKNSGNIRNEIVGTWVHGGAKMEFNADGTFNIDGELLLDYFYNGAKTLAVDRWTYSQWTLGVMNSNTKEGCSISIIQCLDNELHLSGCKKRILVDVWKKSPRMIPV